MFEPVTMEDWDAEEPRPAPARPFWPAWSWPLLAWLPLDAWHTRLSRDMPGVDPAVLARVHLSQGSIVLLATATVAVLALAEALFYGMLWAARSRPLPVLATAVVVLQCGFTELLALDLLARARDGWGGAVVLLAGPRALLAPGAAAGAMTVAFGSAGLLALARCALFAGFQSSLVPCRWREAFAVTCGVWLASHLAQGWLLDLLQGRSLRP
jgi:hypothetical protein